jgi:hypothetical protein
MNIRSFLKPDEKIMTVGRYNVNNFSEYVHQFAIEQVESYGSEFFWDTMTMRKSSTYSVFNLSATVGKSSKTTDDYLECSHYTLTTYDSTKTTVLGTIRYSSNFTISLTDFSEIFSEFMVTGKSGIYNNVVRVIRAPKVNDVRRVFFVVKKNKVETIKI